MEATPKFKIKPIIVIFLTASACAFLLAGANELLRDRILANEAKVFKEKLTAVLPGVEPKNIDTNHGIDGNRYYIGCDAQGHITGYAFSTKAEGYAGVNEFLVGYNRDLTKIVKLGVVKHSETPGLGANMEKDAFKSLFEGKGIDVTLVVVKNAPQPNENEINAIAGSTITTKSVVRAVNAINTQVMEWKQVGRIALSLEKDAPAKEPADTSDTQAAKEATNE